MSAIEILLIIAGVIIMFLGYALPAKKKETDEDMAAVSEEEVKRLIDKEVEGVKGQISDIVDETINYSMEKTERAMERIANEKIMAVNEYSDTVLDEINKNHKEVLFLYDMLNDKHNTLLDTVSQATKTSEEIKQTLKDAEITAKEAELKAKGAGESAKSRIDTVFDDGFVPIMPPRVEIVHAPEGDYIADEDKEAGFEAKVKMPVRENDTAKEDAWSKFITMGEDLEENPKPDVDLSNVNALPDDAGEINRNSNDRILELHKAGKSDISIAKELGLGIGEVKLVIDLFEGV